MVQLVIMQTLLLVATVGIHRAVAYLDLPFNPVPEELLELHGIIRDPEIAPPQQQPIASTPPAADRLERPSQETGEPQLPEAIRAGDKVTRLSIEKKVPSKILNSRR